jgi:cbb3-type cytochrome oxidase maturation protein
MSDTALVFLTLVGFTAAAVVVFLWAAKSGQFRDFNSGARVIFDADEPEGQPTDCFPGERPPSAGVNPTRDAP